jgi:hypothetical protein
MLERECTEFARVLTVQNMRNSGVHAAKLKLFDNLNGLLFYLLVHVLQFFLPF